MSWRGSGELRQLPVVAAEMVAAAQVQYFRVLCPDGGAERFVIVFPVDAQGLDRRELVGLGFDRRIAAPAQPVRNMKLERRGLATPMSVMSCTRSRVAAGSRFTAKGNTSAPCRVADAELASSSLPGVETHEPVDVCSKPNRCALLPEVAKRIHADNRNSAV